MRALVVAVVTALLLSVTGCGDDGPPTQEEIAAGLQKSGEIVFGKEGPLRSLTKEVADCVAQVLADSDLSLDTLKAIAKGEKGYKEGADDAKKMLAMIPQFFTCVADGVSGGKDGKKDAGKKAADKKGTGDKGGKADK